MKAKHFALLSMLILFFTACNFKNYSNETPRMGILVLHNHRIDTLKMYYTNDVNVFRLDTINLGDSIFFKLILNGVENDLTEFSFVSSDTTATKTLFPPISSLDTLFVKSKSDYVNGKFTFQPKALQMYLPVNYVGKKVTTTVPTVKISLTSNATFDNDPNGNKVSVTIQTPFKDVNRR